MAFSFFGLFAQQKSKKEQSKVKNHEFNGPIEKGELFLSRRSFLLTLGSLGTYCFLQRLYGKKSLSSILLGTAVKKNQKKKSEDGVPKGKKQKTSLKESSSSSCFRFFSLFSPSPQKKPSKTLPWSPILGNGDRNSPGGLFINNSHGQCYGEKPIVYKNPKVLLDHKGQPLKSSKSLMEYPRGTLDKTPVFYCVNTHTGDRFVLEKSMCAHPEAFLHAMKSFSHFCRDHRQNSSFPMDGGLLYILGILGHHFGPGKEMRLISGYRHPKSNALLRGRSKGVAENSFHCKGKALDVKIQHISNGALSSFLKKLPHHQGGVGLYGAFVHFDTRGHKAFWRGH